MDTPVERFGWNFIIDIALNSQLSIAEMRNMSIKALMYLQEKTTELFEFKTTLATAGMAKGMM